MRQPPFNCIHRKALQMNRCLCANKRSNMLETEDACKGHKHTQWKNIKNSPLHAIDSHMSKYTVYDYVFIHITQNPERKPDTKAMTEAIANGKHLASKQTWI